MANAYTYTCHTTKAARNSTFAALKRVILEKWIIFILGRTNVQYWHWVATLPFVCWLMIHVNYCCISFYTTTSHGTKISIQKSICLTLVGSRAGHFPRYPISVDQLCCSATPSVQMLLLEIGLVVSIFLDMGRCLSHWWPGRYLHIHNFCT